ncbi:hypothetical protein L2E82_36456 [Cichorium intybus]|uniref:Uncharacterized protein n=1 Tax=Cichorium intybus TaxID=13427 RepID=A0ACB9BRL2_CICIN|nr:hypothetical protein L2E82_36456 [Cichorium intybus]
MGTGHKKTTCPTKGTGYRTGSVPVQEPHESGIVQESGTGSRTVQESETVQESGTGSRTVQESGTGISKKETR